MPVHNYFPRMVNFDRLAKDAERDGDKESAGRLKAKAEKIMKELQIAESRRLRGLGDRQRAALLERLG